MARILICEPDQMVKTVLERVVADLGHDPVATMVPKPWDYTSADVLIIDPAELITVTLARAAQMIEPSLPVICVSGIAPPPDLGVAFTAVLLKPFTIEQLGGAIDAALRAR